MRKLNRGISSLPKFGGVALSARKEGDAIWVSAEAGDGCADYWADGGPWIHPRLLAWAEKRGTYWEWNDPGTLVAYP